MAARLIRIVLAALLALAILVVGGTGLALLAFNPNAFKSALIGAVQQRYHRRLELPGRLQLHLFPPFTLQTGPMRLSATDGHTPFAQAADMRLHLDALQLLQRKVVIDGIELDAPRLQLRRDAAGHWNFADLLTAPSSKVPSLAIHGLSVRAGDIALSDALRGLDGQLSGVDAEASGIGLAGWHALSLRGRAVLSKPRADAQFNLRGQLHVDTGGAASLRNLVLRSDGSLLGGARMLSNLRADLQWTPAPASSLQLRNLQLRAQGRMRDGQPLQVQLSEPLLDWRPTWTRAAALQGQALIGAAPRTLRVSLQGGPVDGPGADLVVSALRLRIQRAAPPALDLGLRIGAHLNLPARSAVLDTLDTDATWGAPARRWQASGQGSYAPAQGLKLRLQGDYAGSPVRIAAAYDAGAWTLQGQAARLDLDGLAGIANARDALTLLRRLPPGQARLQVDALDWGALHLSSLTAQAHDDASTLSLDKLQARAWGGELQARADMDLRAQRAALHASLRNGSVAAMLRALYGHAAVEGQVQGQADLAWSIDHDHLLRSSGGSVSLQVRNGLLHGVDLRAPTGGEIAAGSASPFTQLDASASIASHAARLQSLQLRSSAGDWGGSGTLALPADQLDLVLRPARTRSGTEAPWLSIQGTPAQPLFAWRGLQPALAAHKESPGRPKIP